MVQEESVDNEEWLEAEPEGGAHVPLGTGVIYLYTGDVGI